MRYIKQYGCKRTGTNYLRALLERNFSDVVVLMHTLGGKHEYPVDLKELLNDYANDPIAFVAMATQAHPAETTRPFNEQQTEFIKNNAASIYDAVLNNKIHYLISIKNPYAWINSNKDPNSWINRNYRDILISHGGYSDSSRIDLLIKLKSKEFNSIYRSYLQLSKQFPNQTTIARYEDILANPTRFLNNISEQLKLTACYPAFADILGKASATDWDQISTSENKNEGFSKDYYLEEKYFEDLPSNLINILEAEIDWELMKSYGYYKQN